MTALHSLLTSLAQSRQQLLDRVGSTDLGQPINSPSKKRVQDVLCHMAQWESTVAASIEAHGLGAQLTFSPFDIDAINARIERLHAQRDAAAVFEFLDRSRKHLVAALTGQDSEAEVVLPWGRRETLVHVAQDMLQHEQHHSAQIAEALGWA